MILRSLKDFVLRLRTRFEKQGLSHHRTTNNFHEVKQIGVFVELTEEAQIVPVERFVKELKDMGKEVQLLILDCQGHFFLENPERQDVFSYKNLGLTGQIKAEKVQDFLDTHFEFLYHIGIDPSAFAPYFLKKSHALCRVGIWHDALRPHLELMVDVPERNNIAQLLKEFLFYTRSISKNVAV